MNRHSREKTNRLRLFSLLKYGTLLEQNSCIQPLKQKTSELHTSHVQIQNFNFQKFPVDFDAMMLALNKFQISI